MPLLWQARQLSTLHRPDDAEHGAQTRGDGAGAPGGEEGGDAEDAGQGLGERAVLGAGVVLAAGLAAGGDDDAVLGGPVVGPLEAGLDLDVDLAREAEGVRAHGARAAEAGDAAGVRAVVDDGGREPVHQVARDVVDALRVVRHVARLVRLVHVELQLVPAVLDPVHGVHRGHAALVHRRQVPERVPDLLLDLVRDGSNRRVIALGRLDHHLDRRAAHVELGPADLAVLVRADVVGRAVVPAVGRQVLAERPGGLVASHVGAVQHRAAVRRQVSSGSLALAVIAVLLAEIPHLELLVIELRRDRLVFRTNGPVDVAGWCETVVIRIVVVVLGLRIVGVGIEPYVILDPIR